METRESAREYERIIETSLPHATLILVLGIMSIATCCCYGIPGIVCGIIAIILSYGDERLYRSFPGVYTQSSYRNVTAGRVCAIIGLSLALIYVAYVIWLLFMIGLDAFTDPTLLQERLQDMLNV